MVWAPRLDLHTTVIVRRAHMTFIFEFSIKTHRLEVAPKPWDSTMEIGNIPADERGV
jgi:hypothetical protein